MSEPWRSGRRPISPDSRSFALIRGHSWLNSISENQRKSAADCFAFAFAFAFPFACASAFAFDSRSFALIRG
jgi:hypothetical protein